MAKNTVIVEDNQSDRSRLEKLLQGAGCMVNSVENGQLAVDAAKRNKPDVIFMDVNMPVMDGFAATRALRGDAASKAIPVA